MQSAGDTDLRIDSLNRGEVHDLRGSSPALQDLNKIHFKTS